jgi:ketosteroid isomerase-like protein
VFELFGQLFTESEGTFALEVTGVTANDVHGAVLVTARASKGGQQLELPSVHVWKLRDGKAVEFWDNPDDLATWDAFWG